MILITQMKIGLKDKECNTEVYNIDYLCSSDDIKNILWLAYDLNV